MATIAQNVATLKSIAETDSANIQKIADGNANADLDAVVQAFQANSSALAALVPNEPAA